MTQEVCRKHNGWSLDDVQLSSEVTKQELEQVKDGPPDGAYVHGLFVDGAAWDNGKLADAEPKKLVNPLPVLFVTGIQVKGHKSVDNSGNYSAPVYTNKGRTGLRYLFNA